MESGVVLLTMICEISPKLLLIFIKYNCKNVRKKFAVFTVALKMLKMKQEKKRVN